MTRNTVELEGMTLSADTLRLQDLIPKGIGFLNDIDAPEYQGYMLSNIPPAHAMEDDEAAWWIDEAPDVWDDLIEVLEFYGPANHYFGAHPDDGACFGWWPVPDEEAFPDISGGAAAPQQGRPVREGDW